MEHIHQSIHSGVILPSIRPGGNRDKAASPLSSPVNITRLSSFSQCFIWFVTLTLTVTVTVQVIVKGRRVSVCVCGGEQNRGMDREAHTCILFFPFANCQHLQQCLEQVG